MLFYYLIKLIIGALDMENINEWTRQAILEQNETNVSYFNDQIKDTHGYGLAKRHTLSGFPNVKLESETASSTINKNQVQ